jgi:uncharacterized SAM-binding protein YcdF (DUF218 family)
MSIELGFLIKKIVSMMLMPLSIGIFLALLALLFLYKKNIKKAKKYLTFSILWIALISYAPFANLMLYPLEKIYPKLEKIPSNIEYILLLGGDKEKRAWEALRLYHKIPNVTIITSGYALHDKISEADKTAKLLIESGVKKEDILRQTEVKDTQEEAIEMKKRVGEKAFILITSAYHMPRAMTFFQQEGLNPIPAPADFNNPKEDGIFGIFQAKQLKKTERAWHEYLGLLWLNIKS